MKRLRSLKFFSLLILFFCLAGISTDSYAELTGFQTFVGTVGYSSDGFGSTGDSGTISANVPVGSTVLAAYLYSATNSTLSTPTVMLAGTAVTFGPRVPNDTACCSLASFRADVTAIVKPIIEAGPGGVYDFLIVESVLGSNTDGEALIVVYSKNSLPNSTVGILDGFASVSGDNTAINFAEPLDPSDPSFFAEMVLGVGFSCCGQESTVNVNGSLLTQHAGNYDDGAQLADGSLITMGGFNDPFSPALPSYADDHERYDLTPFVDLGDTTISVDTVNASGDDNIFVAVFYVSGEAGINEPPPEGCSGSLTITNDTLPSAPVGINYSYQLDVTGSEGPYTWSIKNKTASGALIDDPGYNPAILDDLTVGESSGVLAWTPLPRIAENPDPLNPIYYIDFTVQVKSGEVDCGTATFRYTDPDAVISAGGEGGGGGGGCFIATAAYGSYLHPDVNVLKRFRDRYLLTNKLGSLFVNTYYRLSPPAADYIAKHDSMRTATRIALTPLVYGIKYPSAVFIIFGSVAVFVGFRIRRKNSKG